MKYSRLIAVSMAALMGVAFTTPAEAQIQQIGVDQFGVPMCMGPLGPGRCADIVAWMQRQAMAPPPGPVFGPPGPIGLPTNVIPHDGQLVAQIAQACNGEPRCMAAAWATEEFRRCSNGVGVPGGCFGPNGEIMRVIRSTLDDVAQGPGPNHDIVGEDGWVCENLLGGC